MLVTIYRHHHEDNALGICSVYVTEIIDAFPASAKLCNAGAFLDVV